LPKRLTPLDPRFDIDSCSELELYVINNFIVSSEESERDYLEYLMASMVYQSTRLNITLMMTFDCNFRCVYCFERWIQDDSSETILLDADSVYDWIVNLIKRYHFQQLDICFHGGEPLMEIDKMVDIASRLKSFCESNHIFYLFTAVTNGYLLNQKNIRSLEEADLSIVQITIDGTAESHNKRRPLANGGDTFDVIVKNIEFISRNSKIKCYLNVVYDSENSNNIFALFDYLHDFGFNDYLSLVVLSSVKPSKDMTITDKPLIQKEDAKFRIELIKYAIEKGFYLPFELEYQMCTLKQKSSFILTPSGSIFKCISGVGMEEFYIGEISDSPDPMGKQAHLIEEKPKANGCGLCPYFPICNQFCKYECILTRKEIVCKKAYWSTFAPLYLELLHSEKYKHGIIFNPNLVEWRFIYN
jgi:uncharacterized protein